MICFLKSLCIDTILVSLHGNEVLHNFLTGKDSYSFTLERISKILSSGINLVVEMILVKSNIDAIVNSIDKLYKMGVRHVAIMRYVKTRYCDDSYVVSDYQMVNLINILEKKFSDSDILITLPCSQRKCLFNDNKPYLQPFNIPSLILDNCEAGKVWASISYDGKMRTCPHSDSYFGDVSLKSIRSIWQKDFIHSFTYSPECNNCTELCRCQGGCPLKLN